jgi:DNA-binding NarL/FixJ family response regulator
VGQDAPIRVMVVDDHPMWRDAVARDLTEAGCDVVATAADGGQALRVAAAVRPDVVVLDLQLPDMSGVEVTQGLRAAHPAARVLVLSASGEQQDVLDAVKAGAVGYLLKSAARPEFLDAVRRTAGGDAVFTPGLAALVLGEFRRLAAGPAGAEADAPRLTERETEVLRMVATGLSYKQIATRLTLSHRTVQNHVQNTLGKLHLHNRVELVRYAIEHGLTDEAGSLSALLARGGRPPHPRHKLLMSSLGTPIEYGRRCRAARPARRLMASDSGSGRCHDWIFGRR